MHIYTDNAEYATRLVQAATAWQAPARYDADALQALATRCFPEGNVHEAQVGSADPWPALFIAASPPTSQFDLLVSLGRDGAALPDGVLCAAGGGGGLHGLRGRPWAAVSGNIHLSIWFAPPTNVVPSATRFLAMAAVSVVETIDRIPGLRGRAGIRWVNDVFVDDGKVCGILTHVPMASSGGVRAAVVGIGLNVEVAPGIEPTPFVPRAEALAHLGTDPASVRIGPVFATLLETLADNYRRLVDGRYAEIVAQYHRRSLVIGRRVAIYHEGTSPHTLVAEGRVARVGSELELYLEGTSQPFTTGRVLIRPD